MPLQPLDFDFPLASEISTRPPHRVEAHELLEEVDAELADRRAFYARLVSKGKMDRAEADRHIDLLDAIRDDLLFMRARGGWLGQRYGWEAKVREIRRELAIRRNTWPKRVASAADPLDQATAARRMERLEAVHFKYWFELFGTDTEFPDGASSLEKFELLRAWHWRRWQWAQSAIAEGGRTAACVPPDVAGFLGLVAQADSTALDLWHDYLAAARKHGFAPMEEAAA